MILDPLHEPAHRWLMGLYAWAGQRAGSLRQYRECVRILEGELGVSPLEETTRLYEAIKENDLPPPPPLDMPGAQSRFFEGIAQVLLTVCDGPSPGVLFIDDVHWADASSLDLLSYLVRRLGRLERRLCVVLSWCEEEVPADHRLRGLLAEAQRARTATVLRLSRLDRAAVEELVGAVVDDANDLGGRLYDETEGLPLFLAEYLAAIASGTLAAEDETWSLPGGVRELLEGRLRAVGETGWRWARGPGARAGRGRRRPRAGRHQAR